MGGTAWSVGRNNLSMTRGAVSKKQAAGSGSFITRGKAVQRSGLVSTETQATKGTLNPRSAQQHHQETQSLEMLQAVPEGGDISRAEPE